MLYRDIEEVNMKTVPPCLWIPSANLRLDHSCKMLETM